MTGLVEALLVVGFAAHLLFVRFAISDLHDAYVRNLPRDTLRYTGVRYTGGWTPMYRDNDLIVWLMLVIVPVLGEFIWLYLRRRV